MLESMKSLICLENNLQKYKNMGQKEDGNHKSQNLGLCYCGKHHRSPFSLNSILK